MISILILLYFIELWNVVALQIKFSFNLQNEIA